MQALLPGMVERRRGSIVVVGSRAAARPWESAKAAAYAAAKAALVGLVKATAAEVLDDGVRLNVVHPSTIDTAANRASMPKADFTQWVSPESLSGVIAFLLSDARSRHLPGRARSRFYGRVGDLSYQYFSMDMCPGLRWRCLRSPRASSSAVSSWIIAGLPHSITCERAAIEVTPARASSEPSARVVVRRPCSPPPAAGSRLTMGTADQTALCWADSSASSSR